MCEEVPLTAELSICVQGPFSQEAGSVARWVTKFSS